jgi:hypothetical protein
MTAREIILDALLGSVGDGMRAAEIIDDFCRDAASDLTAAGYRLLGPDDAKLIQTALEHASFALDGIVALDDEDMGKDGGSATAQHTKRTVDRALKALLASRPLPLQETEK